MFFFPGNGSFTLLLSWFTHHAAGIRLNLILSGFAFHVIGRGFCLCRSYYWNILSNRRLKTVVWRLFCPRWSATFTNRRNLTLYYVGEVFSESLSRILHNRWTWTFYGASFLGISSLLIRQDFLSLVLILLGFLSSFHKWQTLQTKKNSNQGKRRKN